MTTEKMTQKKGMRSCIVYLTKLGWSSLTLFLLKTENRVFSFPFLSSSSDSMCAFLLCYWLCCKQSSEQNWFMIHFAAIQTASREVTKKLPFCTHLINEIQSKTRPNRTPTWRNGSRIPSTVGKIHQRDIQHFQLSREHNRTFLTLAIVVIIFLLRSKQ